MSWFGKPGQRSRRGSNFQRRQSAPSYYSTPSPSISLPPDIVTSNQSSLDDSIAADELDSEIYFGSLRGNIVGIRYYKGSVNNKEMVALEREPRNPYDCNAIKVKNVLGEQVGHIKRELAKPLAFILDKNLARLEGIVPFGMQNMYSMPVDLSLWGNSANKQATITKLRSHGYQVTDTLEGGPGSDLLSSQPKRTFLAPGQMQNELDKLFETLKEEDKLLESDASEAIATHLYPHQKQALRWMIEKENNKTLPPFWEERNGKFFNTVTIFTSAKRPESVCGGILADDMGLGKTLEVITLILTNFADGKPLAVPVPGKMRESRLLTKKMKANTDKKTAKKGRKKLELAAKKESVDRSEELKFEIKAASSRVERSMSEEVTEQLPVFVRRHSSPGSRSACGELCCVECDLPFSKSLTLSKWLERLKCGKLTGRTQTKGARATLIVCPLSVLSNWLDQLEAHVHENVHLEIYTYYGQGRVKDSSVLSKQDVVLTTYSTLAADFKADKPLSSVKWLRIVLDEGHTIRNPQALQTKAILDLKAERKWVVTGTPIQNSIKDLWSLVNFLQISPFTDRQWWHRTIERPLDRGDDCAIKRIQHLMASIALRRTKTMEIDGKPIIKLPERNVYIEHVKLSEDERSIYQAMLSESKLQVSKYFKLGTLLNNYGHVLAILMRLRQLCCHPLLLAKATAAIQETLDSSEYGCHIGEDLRQKLIGTLLTVLGSGSDEECAICLEALKFATITHCAHVFCRPCIEAVIRNEKLGARCPLCRGELSLEKLLDVPSEVIEGETNYSDITEVNWKSSAKVDALMLSLQKLREKDKSIKSIVVSQFTSMLSLLEIPLRMQGFNFVRLDGTMTSKRRTEVIRSFTDERSGSPTIILLSLKAGGVGINLTAASRVFLIDPSWNPASEEQVFDRCHRLGQTKDVVITKFVVEDSVEQRMLELQEKKRKLMQGAFKKKISAEEKRNNRITDLKTLIDI
ncbi:hypothetical protein ScPMuIL_017731 [Solemya velum]